MSPWLFIAAQCSAVSPSACAAFTSAPCCSRARTCWMSPACAASATGASGGVAAASIRLKPRIEARRTIVDCFDMEFSRKLTLPISSSSECERTRAVPEGLDVVHTELVEQREEDIRHRCARRRADVVLTLHQTVRSTQEEERAADMVVKV